ncbi:hypothetical protein PVL29_019821 [Vitis rotundifolia]|uniref:C3H1-type domain-containing protein n=1 Tax=Vitis rotundifolia TaxID=103349 RepID=A0AA39DE96_VITRO|nr:hypothetical protein PVL29_019821 [Vitis rotundifolia]
MDDKRVKVGGKAPVRTRGRGGYGKKKNGAVCMYWLQGRCNRNPCRFVHAAGEVNITPNPTNSRSYTYHRKNPTDSTSNSDSKQKKQKQQQQQSLSLTSGPSGDRTHASHISQQDSHPESHEESSLSTRGSSGDGIANLFMRLAQLDGHNKTVTGIALPSGSDKLYTASGDGDLRVWDCHTGRCVHQGNLGAQIGCLISQGPWLFAGLRNLVKAWNLKTETQYSIDGPVGQVYALEATTEDVLFAGMEDGSIFTWKYDPKTDSFPLITIFKGHTASVLSLQVGCKSLYSGSMDNTIRRWDLDTLTCSQTLLGHSAAVTSLVLSGDGCLLSCSLDQTIKIWACRQDGSMGVFDTRNEEHPILALFGMHDAHDKPILCCSCNDNSVILYELPSFTKRGTIFGKQEVGRIQSGLGGLFFTGDGTGQVAVWKWLTPRTA